MEKNYCANLNYITNYSSFKKINNLLCFIDYLDYLSHFLPILLVFNVFLAIFKK